MGGKRDDDDGCDEEDDDGDGRCWRRSQPFSAGQITGTFLIIKPAGVDKILSYVRPREYMNKVLI